MGLVIQEESTRVHLGLGFIGILFPVKVADVGLFFGGRGGGGLEFRVSKRLSIFRLRGMVEASGAFRVVGDLGVVDFTKAPKKDP